MGRPGRKSGDANYEVRVEKVQGHIPEIVFRYHPMLGGYTTLMLDIPKLGGIFK